MLALEAKLGSTNPAASWWRPWRLVLGCAALMGMSSGIWYTASVFFVALMKDFGWHYASTASIFSLFIVLYGASAILLGPLVDHFGSRLVVLTGGVLLPLALLASSLVSAFWQLYVTHSLLSAIGLAATSYVPVSLILTRRFGRGRGLVYGIASAGVGIGIWIFVPLAQVLIDLWGWRLAFRALAMIAALVILPVGFFALREESPAAHAGKREDDEWSFVPDKCAGEMGSLRAAVSRREFWLVAGTYIFMNGPTQLLLTHHVAHLQEVGQPKMLVVALVGMVGLFSVPAKIGWGFLSDRFWLELIYLAGCLCIAGAGFALLAIEATSPISSLYSYIILISFGYAVGTVMNPILSGRFFEGPHFGIILGVLNTFYHGAAASAVWLAGYAHDATGSYRLSLVGCALSACLGAGCVWLAAPRRIAPRFVAPES